MSMYRELSMDKLPPMLRKNKEFTYQNLNNLIINVYNNVLLEQEQECSHSE